MVENRFFRTILLVSFCIFPPLSASAAEVTRASVNFQIKPERSASRLVIKLEYAKAAALAEMMAFQGLNLADPEARAKAMRDFRLEILAATLADGDTDKQAVSIHIPLLDYGAGGAFTDAVIIRNGAASFDTIRYNRDGKFKYVGDVVITEFTKLVIAGTYNGKLFIAKPLKQVEAAGAAIGTFRIVLPVLSDPRETHDLTPVEQSRFAASVLWDALRLAGISLDDVDNMPTAIGRTMRNMRGGRRGGSGGGGGASALPRNQICTCECEHYAAEKVQPNCARQCQPAWRTNQCSVTSASTRQADDEEIARFKAAMQNLGMNDAAVASFSDRFQQASPGLRETMWRNLESAAKAMGKTLQ